MEAARYLAQFRGNRMRVITAIATSVALSVCCSVASAESVYVKYRGQVDLKPFDCLDVTRSSFIQRVCYDRTNEYMLISLNGTYYHYCEIDPSTGGNDFVSGPETARHGAAYDEMTLCLKLC
jgi:hypothetical protein